MRRRIGVIAALAALSSGSGALALDRWTTPYPGVRHLLHTAPSVRYHVVLVDLADPRVEVVATDESFAAPAPGGTLHRWRSVSSFARASGASIAVNANYYDVHRRVLTTCGLAMSRGVAWRTAYSDRRLACWSSVGFGQGGRAQVFDSHGAVSGEGVPPWMTEVVTGSPRVLEGGTVLPIRHPRHALARNPRTLVGLSEDRRTLFLMVVDGREGSNQGLTVREAGRALLRLGAWDAVNLDGGASSALWVASEGGIVNRPCNRVERPVANHLGVVIREAPSAGASEEPTARGVDLSSRARSRSPRPPTPGSPP